MDRLPVYRPGLAEGLLPGGGEYREAGSTVSLVGLAFGQARRDQLVHDPAHPGPAEHGPLAQLAHPQLASGGSAAGTVDREDWGLTWNLPLDGGRLLVSKEIRIEIELEAVLQPEA
jgi:hypothetical protein